MRVLIVGNGFDRKLGLKTDYISFLDWMQEKGYGVGERFAEYSKKIHFPYLQTSDSRIKEYKEFAPQAQFEGEIFNILNPTSVKYFQESKESYLANSLLYVLPEITSNNPPANTKHPNIWYSFIQLLRYQKKNKLLDINTAGFEKCLCDEGNWVDIEGLIQKSIETIIQQGHFKGGIFSISSHFDVFSLANLLLMDLNKNHQIPKEEVYALVWKDFLEFKKILCCYLTPLSEKIKKNWPNFEKASLLKYSENEEINIIRANSFEKIIDFNYTDFGPENPNLYYVHGNIDDLKNVVFGLDMNIRGGEFQKDERKTGFELSLIKNKELLKFSKISQLLHLQVDKVSHPLTKITELSIVGHSIGEQDYSYYFSILDRNVDNIQLNCFWYEFNEGGNNKESMKDALFEMLTEYEKYSNQRILHKMIFEGRIKFKEVFIPKIILE